MNGGSYFSSIYGDINYDSNHDTYMVKENDYKVCRYDLTSDHYTEMEVADGKLRFNGGPLNYTHSYALVVASSGAGYDGCIFDFEQGMVKKVTSMNDITEYEPRVIDHNSVARKHDIKVDVTLQLESIITAVDDIEAADNAPAVYYDLSGRQSSTPFNGVNIVKRGNKVTKEIHN